jgi:large subunit ribosomal protein L4
MASLPIHDRTGKQVGTYDIDPAAIAPSINKQLLHDVVVMYQANQRQGTFATKSRGEVAGTTKKMYRQKGTGHARAGSRRAVQRRGGGHAFAKEPRDFGYRIPRKALQLATRMALASKIADNQLVVIDDLKLAAPKTKEMAGILAALKLKGSSVLVTTNTYDENAYKSARNIEGVSIAPAAELNAYCLLKPRRVLITKAALDGLRDKAVKVNSEKKPKTEKKAEKK